MKDTVAKLTMTEKKTKNIGTIPIVTHSSQYDMARHASVHTPHNRLYNRADHRDSCGVGFITRKDGVPTHTLVDLGHEALCCVPHRCGVDVHGVGDGGGVLVDLSECFFSKITGRKLTVGNFGVGNFFLPKNVYGKEQSRQKIEKALAQKDIETILWRQVPVDVSVVNHMAQKRNPPIWQAIFMPKKPYKNSDDFEKTLISVAQGLGDSLYADDRYSGFYPISISSRTVVYKGCLNSHEVVPYFTDLMDKDFTVKIFLFHTRYSTNTAPHPSMAQPFTRMAHNGELNTDKKNRIHDDSILRTKGRRLITPKGQSDSGRFDQTLTQRMCDDNMGILEAFVRMSPPAWEKNKLITGKVRSMLEYYSLSEEKIDGPAALLFTDGVRIGAKLDRLGLRPLRQTETTEYISVMSEAGQNVFDPKTVISRGRIEAGGMVVYDHEKQHFFSGEEILQELSEKHPYDTLLQKAVVRFDDLEDNRICDKHMGEKSPFPKDTVARAVAYGHNGESFRFMLDPILHSGLERISAMGYGIAINPLNAQEGGMFRYFSQRFAQVTNPPLDSIREADGMTLRVSLGAKPTFCKNTKQIIVNSPILDVFDMEKIKRQRLVNIDQISAVFAHREKEQENVATLQKALEDIGQQALKYAKNNGIIIVSDASISRDMAAVPMVLCVAHINHTLIRYGLRFNTSIVVETGQAISSHHMAVLLGFGASAICGTTVYARACELYPDDVQAALSRYKKGCEKALMKTMGKFGLCTIESYSGGEFFEANYIDTQGDAHLKKIFFNIDSPVGGVGFQHIATSARDWHLKALQSPDEYPNLGLFKEKSGGASHSYGIVSTKAFESMTGMPITYAKDAEKIPLGTWILKDHMDVAKEAVGGDVQYLNFGYERLSQDVIDAVKITKSYRQFSKNILEQRLVKPTALRDILAFPLDLSSCETEQDFVRQLSSYTFDSTTHATIRDIPHSGAKRQRFEKAVKAVFNIKAQQFIAKLSSAPNSIPLDQVQSAGSICQTFASGAMSFGALNRNAHEAVAMGTNIVGAKSNCGEGGEQYDRFNTLRSSTIKQIASGRFGVWAGYFADPNLQEIEIKLAQGAKPGEGGQLPAQKVTVDIASMRGGTPMVELISPPPHHDTYSIEDLAQLIHDAHCTGAKVIVKLVSSEGIGTIAVGIAKAGADVINIAGGSGGTGAAQVTSLKYTGRSSEIGIAEVHQALCDNGLRDKVVLRNSGAFQNGYDIVKAAILGADSFEFGTSALMMLGCVMAKNCNIKCPAGLTTNPEIFTGDARALAQYFINVAHEVREVLAYLGFNSLKDIRGRTDLLHLYKHPTLEATLDFRRFLHRTQEKIIQDPKYLEPCYSVDDAIIDTVKETIVQGKSSCVFQDITLNNCNRSVGGKTAVDIERLLSYTMKTATKCVVTSGKRPLLREETVILKTRGSAGQSYGVFTTSGMKLHHTGTCNDGVGKSMCGGIIVVKNPGLSTEHSLANYVENVLVGNFALFGATGGKVFIEGEAGDRFAVRNTGALGVVEGVGEFACEYMINGTILNLGKCGKGFGNGMSGGTAYQYDPEGLLSKKYATDSIHIGKVGGSSPEEYYHQDIVKDILTQHVKHTDSQKARHILLDWDRQKHHFYFAMPLALYATQRPSSLCESLSEKHMIEELSQWYVLKILRTVKRSYTSICKIFNGEVPKHKKRQVDLLLAFTIVQMATKKAQDILHKQNVVVDDSILAVTIKKLLITENKDMVDTLTLQVKGALKETDKDTLSVWLSQKRIDNYMASLKGRDTQEIQNASMIKWVEYISDQNAKITSQVGILQDVVGKKLLLNIMEDVPSTAHI